MAATVFQQPPSPPHSKAHYFPPSAGMSYRVHAPPSTNHQSDPQSSHHPHPPQPSRQSRPSVVKDDTLLVHSKMPTGLPSPNATASSSAPEDDQPEGTQEATITWRGAAREVYLTGISDSNDRPYRVKMVHEPGSKSTFFTTLRLPPGNHPLRFLVDDQPKITDTLPTATDADGSLINYIEIPSPTQSPSRSRSNTGNGWQDGGAGSVLAGGPTAQGDATGGKWFVEMEWSSDIPPRLFKLAAEEEAYLAARAAAAQNPHPPHLAAGRQYPPLPPPPPVPYPPSLPRHLEKVILNNSSNRNPNAASYTPAILASSSSARPRIIGTGTTGPLIPPAAPRPRGGVPAVASGIGAQIQANLFGGQGVPPSGGILSHSTEGAGDDNSVLPVPNHVVLNHLGTSAIKNGVLAVGTTTRYHRKYISTIYYKPI